MRRLRRRLGAVAGALALVPAGYLACVVSTSESFGPSSTSATSTGTTATSGASFDKRALLGSVTALVEGDLAVFAKAADALAAATEALAKAPSPDGLKAAQEAYRVAVLAWQRLELAQVGPAAVATLPGGKGLRDEIYSWPSVNRCAVDQELAKDDHADPKLLAAKLVNVRGLGALEHLLFDEDATNACSAQNALNTSGAWTAVESELPLRRARYAHSAASLVASTAAALRAAWAKSGSGFATELSTPGATFGGDPAKALDAVAYAFGYLDTRTKDLKLAVPAGLAGCPTATCPEALELAESRLSKRAIRENLVAYQRLYHGGAPFDDAALGFDDWLEALGANELRGELAAAIAAALAAVDALEEDDLAKALADDPKSVEDAYLAVKKVTDLFKSQLVTVLDLHPPSDAPTDND